MGIILEFKFLNLAANFLILNGLKHPHFCNNGTTLAKKQEIKQLSK